MRFLSPEETLAFAGPEAIAPGEIHVWAVCLTGSVAARARCTELLEPEERERAARFYSQDGHDAFTFAHGQLRHLLARYCGVEGSALRFCHGEHGKPQLAVGQWLDKRVFFNLTHSAGRALVAISANLELGIDLEAHERRTDVLRIADRYFFGSEAEMIRAAPEADRRALFFFLWTAKEAVIKAQGGGLSVPLDAFRVVPLQDRLARVETFDTSHVDTGWFVHLLPCAQGWSAALAAKSEAPVVRVLGK